MKEQMYRELNTLVVELRHNEREYDSTVVDQIRDFVSAIRDNPKGVDPRVALNIGMSYVYAMQGSWQDVFLYLEMASRVKFRPSGTLRGKLKMREDFDDLLADEFSF